MQDADSKIRENNFFHDYSVEKLLLESKTLSISLIDSYKNRSLITISKIFEMIVTDVCSYNVVDEIEIIRTNIMDYSGITEKFEKESGKKYFYRDFERDCRGEDSIFFRLHPLIGTRIMCVCGDIKVNDVA